MKRIIGTLIIFLILVAGCNQENYKGLLDAQKKEKISRYLANEKYFELSKKIKNKQVLKLINKKIKLNNAFMQFNLLNRHYKEYKKFITKGKLEDKDIFADYKLSLIENRIWEAQVLVLETTLEDLLNAFKKTSLDLKIYENKYIRESEMTYKTLTDLDNYLNIQLQNLAVSGN